MSYLIGKGRYARETYPTSPTSSPGPPADWVKVASGELLIPGVGLSPDIGPFVMNPGKILRVTAMVRDLDGGGLAANDTNNVGGFTQVTWAQHDLGIPGSTGWQFTNSSGADKNAAWIVEERSL